MSPTRIAELAATIATKTAQIDSHLTTYGLRTPSFDTEIPSQLFTETCLENSRRALLEATMELHDLMRSPAALVMDHAVCSDLMKKTRRLILQIGIA